MKTLQKSMVTCLNFFGSIGKDLLTLSILAAQPTCSARRLRRKALRVLVTQLSLYAVAFGYLWYFLILDLKPDQALAPWNVIWGEGTLGVVFAGALFMVVLLDAVSMFLSARSVSHQSSDQRFR